MRDKDWWWGRRAPPSGHWSQSDALEDNDEDTGWFPSTFVRVSKVSRFIDQVQ